MHIDTLEVKNLLVSEWKKTKLDRQISWTALQFTSACTSGIAYINKLSLKVGVC